MAVGWQIGVSLSTQVDFSCSFPEQLNSSGDLQAVEEGEEGRRREEGEEGKRGEKEEEGEEEGGKGGGGGVEGGGGGRAYPPPFSATWRSWLAQTQQCARARTLKEVFTGTGSDSTAKQGSQLQVAFFFFFFFCIATAI